MLRKGRARRRLGGTVVRRKAALICAAVLWLCSWPVFAVETESCTLDTPAEWGGAISISDTYDQTEYTGIEA